MHQRLQNLQILHSGHLDILLRSWHNMHLTITQLRTKRTGCDRVCNPLPLSLPMGLYDVLKVERLGGWVRISVSRGMLVVEEKPSALSRIASRHLMPVMAYP